MLIVLDCPRCAKRYEVDATLAGKKSRCKQCGEVFKIPVPRAIPASLAPTSKSSRPTPPASVEAEWRSVLVRQSPDAAGSRASTPSRSAAEPTRRAGATIVLNCPRCGKRYEVDGALAGKKSRCKDCGDLFSIPVPRAHAGDSATAAAPAAPSAPPPRAHWESVLEEEPASLKASRGPAQSAYDDGDLPPPPRATYTTPRRGFYSQRDRGGNNPDLGLTIALFYVGLAILVGIGFWIWTIAAEPTKERFAAIFALVVFFVHLIAGVLGFAGNIWVLVLAFREKLEQGLLCLLVPCYALYYIFSRWEDTKGAFILMLLPAGNMVVVAAVAFSLGFVNGYERVQKLTDNPTPSDVRGPELRPGGGPPPGWRPRGGAGPSPRFGFMNPRDNYQRIKDQYGSQAVTVLFKGLPTNSDPARGVTTRDVSEALNGRIRALAPSATDTMSIAVDNDAALIMAPVDDIQGLANRIDFGRVVVKGDRIDVQVSPEYIASVPRLPAPTPGAAGRSGPPSHNPEPEIPADADAVTRSLIELKSPDINKKKEGLRRLERTPPDQRSAEVVAALLPLLDDDDGWLVGDTIKVLAVWKSPEAVPALIHRMIDNRGFVRHEAIKALVKIKDPRAVEPIVARLKEDGHEAVQALREMGPIAEPALIERLTNPDADIRKRACEVLKEIGGREALKAMHALPADPDFFVRVAAQDAMKNIVARVGPLPASERKDKAGASAPLGRGPKR